MDKSAPNETPSEDRFEEFVAAALKVDPKGLSGKHRKDGQQPRHDPTKESKPS